ncbi:MAG: histidinol-phosphatase HisJ family protein [Lachnospiraceae bacterium]|nr:histidinol-phosphatase HisJ family protein [Lachnospiraceae bacterium]
MIADLHIHTHFSADSEEDPRAQIESAIAKHADILCFTDHMDYDFGSEGDTYTFDPDAFFQELQPLQKEYADDIKVLIGVEFGMQPHLRQKFETLKDGWPFDYILGSQHLVYGQDPYYPDVFRGREDTEVIRRWFRELHESLQVFPEINALAHIDYIFRYVQDREKKYPYEMFEEDISGILKQLVKQGTALELNTGGFRKISCISGFHGSLLDQYEKEGGRVIVTGSDAHEAGNVLIDYDSLPAMLSGRDGLSFVYYEKQLAKSLCL